MLTIQGQCHCGNLSSHLDLPEHTASLTLYGCSCSFCRLHACTWLGEPAQKLTLSAESPEQSTWYATGQLAPNYLLCRRCGVVLAAVSYFEEAWYAILNAQTALLPALPQDFLPFRQTNLTDQQRLTLRRQRWVRGVELQGLPWPSLQPSAQPDQALKASLVG